MKINYLFVLAIFLAAIVACSSSDQAEVKENTEVAENSDEAQLVKDITEFFERMREGDKTVLYENEFEYYKLEVSLDDYYSFEQIMAYQYDTMKAMTVDSVMIEGDSAYAYIEVTYEYRAGGEVTESYPVRMYRSGDHWIKNSLSHVKNQREYEAFKESEREAEEFEKSGGN